MLSGYCSQVFSSIPKTRIPLGGNADRLLPYYYEQLDGVDRIVWGNDFRHSAGDWLAADHRRSFFRRAGRRKEQILCENVADYFHLQ
jgi:hypothetical protein